MMLSSTLRSRGQQPEDLSRLTFTENTVDFFRGFSDVKAMQMYDLPYMLSYGIDNGGKLVYNVYTPRHVELLAFKDRIAGFSFRIWDFGSQEKLLVYLTKQYTGLALIDSSRWGKIYRYADANVTVELQTISVEDFKNQRAGYLSVKTAELIQAIAAQEKKYQRKG